MGLMNLLMEREKLEQGEPVQTTLRISQHMLDQVDELAAEIGCSRQKVMLEMFDEGFNFVMGQWEQALEQGRKNASA